MKNLETLRSQHRAPCRANGTSSPFAAVGAGLEAAPSP